MSDTQSAPYPDVAMEPPPPPVQKPPTLAAQLIDQQEGMTHALKDMEITIDGTAAQVWQALGSVRVLAIWACVMFGLSLLVSIATLVLVAFLVGHVR